MTDREKLIELLLNMPQYLMGAEGLADHLIDNGVTFATDNNIGDKRIEELEAKLAEREEAVCNLRKKWQAAETHICTMCGHFDHKTDGNIVYGNKTCGELVGYPCCGKFTPWIPVTERFPEPWKWILCYCEVGNIEMLRYDDFMDEWGSVNINMAFTKGYVTHWMPLPEPPKGK